MSRAAAIVLAAGASHRMHGVDKLWHPIAGRPLLAYSVETFESSPDTAAIVLVAARDRVEDVRSLARASGWSKVVAIVAGGPRRQDSVRLGLAEVARVTPACDVVMIHDGARPLVTHALVREGLRAVAICGAAIPALPAADSVKEVAGDDVVATADRGRLRLVQTPQVFSLSLVARAHAAPSAQPDATDDAALVERLGERVVTFPGSPSNLKVTTPEDLLVAEALLARVTTRVGIGFDQHALEVGRPLVLGGVVVPHDRGLVGHSDADALLHAIVDALLGAAALGDMGSHFPSSDPRWRGVASSIFLEEASRLLRARGWIVENVDATIVAQEPALAPHLAAMRAAIAGALAVDLDRVSVKAKSTDALGSVGRGEGIACHAVAMIARGPSKPGLTG